MIPDEAVEAAAFELYKEDWWGKPTAWPEPPFADDATLEDYKADYLKTARLALEAATPHLTNTPAEQAMADIEAHLERWFNGEQTQTAAMAAAARISGKYKMEGIK